MLPHSSRRLAVLFVVLALCGLALPAVATASPTAAPATAAAEEAAAPVTSSAHPFSAPRYLPVRGARVFMDCYKSNDPVLCPTTGRSWQMNLLAAEYGADAYVPVHAMGAGRFTLLRVEERPCGAEGMVGIGTQVQVDHGGGVVSRYGHLNNRDLRLMRSLDGQLVAAGQRIGSMGTTGVKQLKNCNRNYTDFWVQRGPGADKFEIETLIACVDGEAQVWPGEMYPNHPTWNQLPKHIRPGVNTVLPTDARADELPDGSCLPDAAPATPGVPAAARLDRAGSNRLVARWAAPPAGTLQSAMMMQIWRAPMRKWNTEEYVYVPGAVSSGLIRGTDGIANGRNVRVFLAHRNAAGWSRWSPVSNTRIVGTAPNAPRLRSLRTFRTRTGGAGILSWTQGGSNGYPVTGWVAQIRPGTSGRWRSYSLPLRTYSRRFDNLAPGRRYQVRVAARSAAGLSPFLVRAMTGPR